MGFAWSAIAGSKKPTFMQDMITQGQLAEPIVSLHLGRGVDTLKPSANRGNGTIGTGSSLTLGGTDPSTVQFDLHHIPLMR